MKKNSKIIIVMLLILIAIILVPNTVQAGLQANKGGTSLASTYASDFFTNIRKMESEGGTLGTASTIDTTNGTYLDSSGNGIDCHMAKNTEWGTAAMLAASIYGTAPSGNSSASTTGNETGVFQMADSTYEYVAGIYSKDSYSYNVGIIKSADARYRDLYSSPTSFTGDAVDETAYWYGTSSFDFANPDYPVYLRSSSALFGISRNMGYASSGYVWSDAGSRAVVVCGAGL